MLFANKVVSVEARVARARILVGNLCEFHQRNCHAMELELSGINQEASTNLKTIDNLFSELGSLLASRGVMLSPLDSDACLHASHRKPLPSLSDATDPDLSIKLSSAAAILRSRYNALFRLEDSVKSTTSNMAREIDLAISKFGQIQDKLHNRIPKTAPFGSLVSAFILPSILVGSCTGYLSGEDVTPKNMTFVLGAGAVAGTISIIGLVMSNLRMRSVFTNLCRSVETETLYADYNDAIKPVQIKHDSLILQSYQLIDECFQGLELLGKELDALTALTEV